MTVLVFLAGISVGALGCVLARRAWAPAPAAGDTAERERLLGERDEARAELSRLGAELARAEAIADATGDQLRAERERSAQILAEHRAEQRERAERQQQESAVLEALAPVRESLGRMQQRVESMESQRQEQFGQISAQLAEARSTDERLRSTTESLAGALRSTTTRGVWGETQLRRVVELAGLLPHVDFSTQQSMTSEHGAARPDMVVSLPGGNSIAVDAKVPLDRYLEASAIPATATGAEAARREALLAAHVKAVRAHVDALAKKRYWTGLDSSPEFVIAFVPSESLLSAALDADPSLLDYAFGRRVALASPVNLWAVLKTVAVTWQQQAVSEEAHTLFELGNTLYQRLGVLAGHADALRRSIESTVKNYNAFASSLESRVLVTARRFPGVDQSALIAEPSTVVDPVRRLSAAEFDDAGSMDTDARPEKQRRPPRGEGVGEASARFGR
ncbi:DNA recombination protein RmuC [Mycetocola reblochoni REB411]|uniref:DNA recombination protein RmuC n=1 Tax=Mycetocola reblochoni REB411 TaxID=1255698 RepID=A0A1R4IKA1_9MICO|nr:DNA recombination protein RmuC [Mycetocola reblochoni REB411]